MSCSTITINRPTSVKIGAVGALEASCTDVGSVRSFILTPEEQVVTGTCAAHGSSPAVDLVYGKTAKLEIVLEDITSANLALSLGTTVASGAGEVLANAATPTYYTVYARGYASDGAAGLVQVYKARIAGTSPLNSNTEQETITLSLEARVNDDGKVFRIGRDAAS